MDGCFIVDPNSCKGGLSLLWKDRVSVIIQNYSKHYVDSVVKMEGND